jgi:hypothetical protein
MKYFTGNIIRNSLKCHYKSGTAGLNERAVEKAGLGSTGKARIGIIPMQSRSIEDRETQE